MALKVTNKNRKKIKQEIIEDEVFNNSNGVIDVDWNSFDQEVPTKNPFASVPYDVVDEINETEEDLKEEINLQAIEIQKEFNKMKLITGIVIFLILVSIIF